MLSAQSREIVQATLPAIGVAISEITPLFYRKMFAAHPELERDLFNRGNQKQGEQQKALADFYDFRKAETMRVAGLDAQAWVFEPKDGLRYGHRFWSDAATGLLLKARVVNERGDVVSLHQRLGGETAGAKNRG